jgi:hypothetical protein
MIVKEKGVDVYGVNIEVFLVFVQKMHRRPITRVILSPIMPHLASSKY